MVNFIYLNYMCLLYITDFIDIVVEILPELSEMNVGIWMINDARKPGLILPASVDAMDITRLSGGYLPAVQTDLESAACFMFTSGTTGDYTGCPKKAERRIFSTLRANSVICFYIIR